MGLEAGASIGPYSIVREIGRGGMGVVYLARDGRLNRDVAIKALPEHLARDPERLARFEGEARALGQLNHPSVAGILGLEEVEGERFLVLEYVEGESLGQRLERGALPVDEAIDVCVKIAGGLEAAHEAGVIHRDLKPDNVKITPDDEVKVLDFGLAKIAEESSSSFSNPSMTESPTMTSAKNSPTAPGMILGTAAYMSPEQARGRRVDKRTDIWSFGVLLYECLTGISPFAGETVSDSIGAILHKDPDLSLLPATTPRGVLRVLKRCLARDKNDRYRDIGDIGVDLVHAKSGAGADIAPAVAARPAWQAIAFAVLLAAVAAAVAWFAKPTGSAELPVFHAEVSLPEGQRMAHYFLPGIALSPDGKTLAMFAGTEPESGSRVDSKHILIRHLDQPNAVPIPGLELEGAEPAFSPDGTMLAYATSDGLFTVPVAGGQPTKLNSLTRTIGLSWGTDGTILAGLRNSGLVRLAATGGEPEPITELDEEQQEIDHSLPHFLPGGRAALFTVLRFGYALPGPKVWSVWAVDLGSGDRRRIVEHASDGRYVDGHLLFMREGSIWAAPFDPRRLELSGDARVVVEGVQHAIYTTSTGSETGAGLYAVSRNGTLAYVPGSTFPELPARVVTVDRDGVESEVGIEARQYLNVRGAPDGRSLALTVFYAPESAVWHYDMERDVARRERDDGTGFDISWGPGPNQITYDRRGEDGKIALFYKTVGADRGDETTIELPPDTRIWMAEWSRDGSVLLGLDVSDRGNLWAYRPGEGWQQLTDHEDSFFGYPTLSPDGRWLAYCSDESTEDREIMVRSFPEMGPAMQVSRGGGFSPAWSHDGSEIFYRTRKTDGSGTLFAVSVSRSGERLRFGKPEALLAGDYGRAAPIRAWDVLADGRFAFIRNESPEEKRELMWRIFPNRVKVVQNWASTLE